MGQWQSMIRQVHTLFSEGVSMKAHRVAGILSLLCFVSVGVLAQTQGTIQKHFSTTATQVQAAGTAAEKRVILDRSFRTMSNALDVAERSASLSAADVKGIEMLRTSLLDKQNELAGTNGFTAVPDAQLNAFSTYVVQDMEQASEMISISLVALLLIILLVAVLF
jgi:hypothetical protein